MPPRSALVALVGFAACHAVNPRAPVVQPAAVVSAPEPPPIPAPPAWPVPVRALRWGADGVVEVGVLPGLDALPEGPWMAEPLGSIDDPTTRLELFDELARHEVPGLALRDRVVTADDLQALSMAPDLRYLDLSGAELAVDAIAAAPATTRLTRLYLARTGLDEAAVLALLTRCPLIEVLDVADTGAGDRTLATAAEAPGLRGLAMAGTAITDGGGLILAEALHLEVLDLARTRAGDDTAHAVAALPLQELYLAKTKVSAKAALDLAPLATTLVRVDLSDLAVDDKAVAWLEAAGGLVEADLGGTKVGDLTAARLASLPALREVDLAETRVGPRGAVALAAVPALERVDLAATTVDDASVRALLAVPALLMLRLDDTAITDAALTAAPPPGLRELYLARTKVGDAGLAILDRTPGLTALGLRRTRAGLATVERIARLSGLRTLDVGSIEVPHEALAALAALPALERLYVDATRTGDVTLAAIAQARLRVLHAQETDVSDESLDLLAAMPLEELAIGDTRVTGALLGRLAAWPRLRTLSLVGLGIDDAAAALLPTARRLGMLDLSSTEITDTAPLVPLRRLAVLGLSHTRVDRDDVTRLAALPRLAELYLSDTALGVDVLPILAAFPALRRLDLRGSRIRPAQARRALPGIELVR